MVGSISSSQMSMNVFSSQGSQRGGNSLSASQIETISSVLQEYDSDSLSSEDAASIVEAFKAAKIEPSKALEEAMEAEGFSAKEVGDLAGVGKNEGMQGGMPPPPPPPSKQEESDVSTLLESLLGIDEDEDLTSSSFSEVLEYTSRILNLNDNSKDEVLNMLDEFMENENDYSSTDLKTLVKTSLSATLSNPNNYNRVSLYA